MNEAEIARKLYPPAEALGNTFRAHEDDEAVILGLTAEQREARHTEFATVVKESGIQAPLGEAIYKAGSALDRARARTPEGEEVAFDGQGAAEARRRELRDIYGAREAEKLMARVISFGEQHAGLGKLLKHERVLYDRDVLHGLVEHVRREGIGVDIDDW